MSAAVGAPPPGRTSKALSLSPLGFSANSTIRPLWSIFIRPKEDARFSSQGSAAMVMSAPDSRWAETNLA